MAVVSSPCGCASHPELKVSARCERRGHSAGEEGGYRLVSHEELRRLVAEHDNPESKDRT